MDHVAVIERVDKPLHQYDAHASAPDGAARFGVKGPAVAIWRLDAAFLIKISTALRNRNRSGAGERHIRLSAEQTLASHMDGDERRGACGLHCNAWPAQIQLVGNARRKIILVIPYHELKAARCVEQRGIGIKFYEVR